MDIQDSHSLSRIAYSKNILERYYAHYIIVLEIYYIANKDKHNQGFVELYPFVWANRATMLDSQWLKWPQNHCAHIQGI